MVHVMHWSTLSLKTHRALTGRECSWCAAAWEKRLERGWSPLVAVMGKQHCRQSWLHYFS